MLKLVHSDPQGWLQNYPRKAPVPARAPQGMGYVYVLQVTGPTAYVKIGSTAQPRTRFEALRSEAHRLGSAITSVWLSPAHPTYHTARRKRCEPAVHCPHRPLPAASTFPVSPSRPRAVKRSRRFSAPTAHPDCPPSPGPQAFTKRSPSTCNADWRPTLGTCTSGKGTALLRAAAVHAS